MIRINILSGARVGEQCRIGNFPFFIGRSAEAQIRIDDSGVWEKHLEVGLDPSLSFLLRVFPEALVALNGHQVTEEKLRNGDLIVLGSACLQFWLDESEQRGLRLREALTWAAIAVVSAAQCGLIYWLLT